MKLILAIAALLIAAPLAAQPPGQQTVFAHIDTLRAGAVDVPASNGLAFSQQTPLVLLGWAVNCYTRQQPTGQPDRPAVQLFYRGTDASGQPAIISLTEGHGLAVHWRLPRPDVSAAFGTRCGAELPAQIGYAVVVTAPLPKGQLSLQLYTSDPGWRGYAWQQFVVVVE